MKSSGILVGILLFASISSAVSAEEQTLTFQEGDGGAYSGTEATSFGTLFGGNSGYALTIRATTLADLPLDISLLRFPDIIGNNVGQIPPGSIISEATLQLTRSTTVNNPLAKLQRAVTPWDEHTVTYDTRPTTSGTLIGPVPPATAGMAVAVTVSLSVQAWASGNQNWGWEIWPGWVSTDEAFYSDDAPTVATRPLLSVTFTPPLTPVEPSTWGKVKALYR